MWHGKAWPYCFRLTVIMLIPYGFFWGVRVRILRLFSLVVFLFYGEWRRVPFLCLPKEKRRKERAPYDLVAMRLPCASRLHWREHKLATLKQVFAQSNEGCDARLHRREGKSKPMSTQPPSGQV